jgi:hypothetical protein
VVSVDGKTGEALLAPARGGPLNLDVIEFAGGSETEDLTGIMRGEIAPAVILQAGPAGSVG